MGIWVCVNLVDYPSPMMLVRLYNLPSVDLLHCNCEDMSIYNVSYDFGELFSRETVGDFMKFVCMNLEYFSSIYLHFFLASRNW